MNIAWFKDLNKDSIPVAGGKGANLGEMYNLGLPIPGGFIVTAQAYKKFLDETGIQKFIIQKVNTIDVENSDQLQQVAKEIQTIISETMPPQEIKDEIVEAYELLCAEKKVSSFLKPEQELFVAVRSSATAEDLPEASFAGQQATFLNVRGTDNVVKAVRECWASLYTARAIYYRTKNNFPHDKVLIAVVVQKMVNSEKSGIMFTANPATNDVSEIVIEAAWGLGEAVVSGSVNPDLYLVDKETKEIKKKELKKQEWGLFRNEKGENVKRNISPEQEILQVLNDKEIVELARLGKKIEDHYGKPQDTEWAAEGNELLIVQARPITTLNKENRKSSDQTEFGKALLKGETASRGVAAGVVKIIYDPSELDKIKKGDIMVTTMTNPDMVPAMQRAAAIVTDEGGLTCHAAIVSREMGIPCIVGTEIATKTLKDGQEITVDATNGIVYDGITKIEEKAKPIVVQGGGSIITATEVKIVMDIPDMADKIKDLDIDGIGLLRLEIMIGMGGIHPAEYLRTNTLDQYTKLLETGIEKLAKAVRGKPVWVRNSDMRTDEYPSLKGADKEPKETDPMIGWHAIRRLLDQPQILKAEFQAIKNLHDKGLKNVGIMLPFVIRTDEVIAAKKLMREVGLEPLKDVDFGVMVETPASVWIIEDLCKEGITFVSFGTNDLTQLTLGLDRNNQRIQKLFDEMHPAVLGEIAKVVKTCKKYKVKSSICGQAGSRPEMAEFLVHIGIDSISAAPDAIDEIRKVVAKTERKLLLEAEREEIEETKSRKRRR